MKKNLYKQLNHKITMDKKEVLECEHELNCIYEEYLTDDEIRVEFECSICHVKFSGVVKRV
jgi:hypothetical protein